MIINHNINALDTCNKLNSATKLKSNAMKKVSSGLRINEAADDAAGSSISEKMKAQIRGLEQAGENIQDGISLVQTAEAGLGSIQDPNLLRMRDLIVQALNGTLKQSDRMIIQNELDNVKANIDDIANDTEFNTTKLLSPPSIDASVQPKWTPGTADIIFVVDRTGSMQSLIDSVRDNIDGFIDKITSNGIDLNMGLVTYGDINNSEPIVKKDMINDLSDFKSYLTNIKPTGGGDLNESGLEGIADTSSGALSYNLRLDSAKQFILITDAPVHDNNSDGDGGDCMSSFDIDDVATELKNKGIKLTVVSNDYYKSQLSRLSDPTGGDYININSNFKDQLSSFASKILTDAGCKKEISTEEMPKLQLQVGANSGEQFQVELFDARTKKLGIDDIKVDPIEEAEKSLEKVDKAIKIVSSQRAKFGTYQNALEHIEKNVDNYGSSISSAESRITNADMAKEAMEITKNSIIEQSAESILKQAEKMPESVINLMNKWQGNTQE
ncbi:flagellin [Clostridium sp. JN-1]|uniref:flagellin N-terminal helical domain-containing protein n=1 Tax=Clostridium sp. JN-1 TaxID=2483110 RepID=UPI000F0B6FDF|nr:flagellin [Clostridium sp. JN-1]